MEYEIIVYQNELVLHKKDLKNVAPLIFEFIAHAKKEQGIKLEISVSDMLSTYVVAVYVQASIGRHWARPGIMKLLHDYIENNS